MSRLVVCCDGNVDIVDLKVMAHSLAASDREQSLEHVCSLDAAKGVQGVASDRKV
jgi:hypothetical protein